MWFTVRGQQIDLAWISQVSGMSLIKNHGRLNLQFISNWLTLACMNFLAWVLSRIMPDLIFPRYLAISCNDKNARHFLDLARYFWYWYVWIMYLCMYVCMYHIIMYVLYWIILITNQLVEVNFTLLCYQYHSFTVQLELLQPSLVESAIACLFHHA